jgi:hypothetical protein
MSLCRTIPDPETSYSMDKLGQLPASTRRMNTPRRLVGLVFAVTTAIILTVAPGGPAFAGVFPPTCGTPSTPPCGLLQ